VLELDSDPQEVNWIEAVQLELTCLQESRRELLEGNFERNLGKIVDLRSAQILDLIFDDERPLAGVE
jgi:hypothetical protein